jgi:hypothetical protein
MTFDTNLMVDLVYLLVDLVELLLHLLDLCLFLLQLAVIDVVVSLSSQHLRHYLMVDLLVLIDLLSN